MVREREREKEKELDPKCLTKLKKIMKTDKFIIIFILTTRPDIDRLNNVEVKLCL